MTASHRPAHTRSTPAADRPAADAGISRAGWWAIALTSGLLLILGYVLAFGPSKHWTPVPAVFLGFFLVSGLIGLVFWKGVRELRAGSGKGGPSVGDKVSTAVAVIALVAGFSFAPTLLQQLPSAMAICPGDATCPPGPGQPTLEMPTQTPGQGNGGQNPTAGQNPGSTAGQGLPPSPTAGAPNNGDNIHGHIPDGSPTPGQQAPNVPGNEQGPTAGQNPGQGQQQQPTGQPQTGQPQTATQQPRITTTPPRRDGNQTTTKRRPAAETSSSSSSSSTTTAPGSGRDRRETDDDDEGRGWPNAVAETASIAGTRRRRISTTRTQWGEMQHILVSSEGRIMRTAGDATQVSQQEFASGPLQLFQRELAVGPPPIDNSLDGAPDPSAPRPPGGIDDTPSGSAPPNPEPEPDPGTDPDSDDSDDAADEEDTDDGSAAWTQSQLDPRLKDFFFDGVYPEGKPQLDFTSPGSYRLTYHMSDGSRLEVFQHRGAYDTTITPKNAYSYSVRDSPMFGTADLNIDNGTLEKPFSQSLPAILDAASTAMIIIPFFEPEGIGLKVGVNLFKKELLQAAEMTVADGAKAVTVKQAMQNAVKQAAAARLAANRTAGNAWRDAYAASRGGKAAGFVTEQHYATSTGARFFDVFESASKAAYETKVGRMYLGRRIRAQVAKDTELLQTGKVSSVTWVFKLANPAAAPSKLNGGPSQPLIDALTKAGIKILYQ